MKRTALTVAFVAGVMLAKASMAGNVTVPNTFVSGNPARAADVNGDFAALAAAINGNAQDIGNLQSNVKSIPAGPPGPQGPQGPAGSGAIMVQDSTGTVVGSYLLASYDPVYVANSTNIPGSSPPEFVFLRTPNRSFAVRFSTATLGALVDYNVSFTSTDCSGQGYLAPVPIEAGFPPVMPILSYAAVLGSTAYIGGTTVSGPFVVSSYLHANGGMVVCSQYSSAGLSSQFVPVVATFDLTTLNLTPPFSIH